MHIVHVENALSVFSAVFNFSVFNPCSTCKIHRFLFRFQVPFSIGFLGTVFSSFSDPCLIRLALRVQDTVGPPDGSWPKFSVFKPFSIRFQTVF